MTTIRSMTGMARAGSVELSTVIGTALGPMMANIARTTNANQTPAERSAAVRGAVGESMAVGQLAAASGMTPRDTLNALSKIRGAVQNPMMAERLDTRLRAANRADLADQMIVRDPSGRASLRNRDAVGMMSSLVSGMGGDANAVANLLSAGGAGAPMVMDSQSRRLITQGLGGGAGAIGTRVAAMQEQGARFGDADIARGREVIDAEQRTALQSSEESRLSALSDNTSSLNQLSNAFAEFTARNPLATVVAATGIPLLGQMAAGFIGRQLAGTSLGTALGVAAPAGGAAAGGGGLIAGVGRAVLGAPALLGSLLTLGGSYGGVEQEEAQRQQREGQEYERQSARLGAAATAAHQPPPTAAQIGAAVAAALAAAPIAATVSAVDATHARTQGATP